MGPERAKVVTPITQEQVETHVLMVLALLSQCHNIRRELCNGLRDEHVDSIQQFVDSTGAHLNEVFADISKQSKLIDDLRGTLNTVRMRCIHMCVDLWSVNRGTPWLGRNLPVPWMDAYQSRLEQDGGARQGGRHLEPVLSLEGTHRTQHRKGCHVHGIRKRQCPPEEGE